MDELPQKKDGRPPLEAMGIVWEILFAIAVPTVLFALGGRFLDRRFETTPIFTLVGVFAALGISFLIVLRKANRWKNK